MVRLIHRSRVKDRDEFNRIFLKCSSNITRKIINRGLVIESVMMMTMLYPVRDIELMNSIGNYLTQYEYTVLIND